jgi:Helix-turn-helix.
MFRASRVGAGLSVRALAKRADISHTSISRWERGEREISDATYEHLTTALAEFMAGRWAA